MISLKKNIDLEQYGRCNIIEIKGDAQDEVSCTVIMIMKAT